MRNKSHCIHVVVTLIVFAILGSACGNMKDQQNFRTLAPSTHFRDGTSAQRAPEHTVPRGASIRMEANAFDDNRLEAVATLPMTLTTDLLQRGQARYRIYCAVCHGEDGSGRGIVVRRGFPNPPSFHDDRLRQASIGHFVNVITHGYGAMYAYNDRVIEADRWAIAAYIRALQRSQRATLVDVPANERAKLMAP